MERQELAPDRPCFFFVNHPYKSFCGGNWKMGKEEQKSLSSSAARRTSKTCVYHCRRNIKYSKDKMWYLAKLVKGMPIDQALAQLEFNDKKGAKVIKEVLLEAQEMAVKTYNVEFKSNMHIEYLTPDFYEIYYFFEISQSFPSRNECFFVVASVHHTYGFCACAVPLAGRLTAKVFGRNSAPPPP
ncbi:39S ribosomal protein L22, mitochondrial [Varanus komodoensis]|nr:39S ribosomal protein L22, mitochondrial [Varanus komodoensis]